MQYLIKKQFKNSAGMVLLEIYHETNKILEKTKGIYWEATKDSPITISAQRKDEYIVSDELIGQKRKNLANKKSSLSSKYIIKK